MSPLRAPEADLEIDLSKVTTLLRNQFPELAELSLRYFESGWDNTLYRLGTEFLIRLPRRKQAVPLVMNEQRCLVELAPRLPFPIPLPRYFGKATSDFPYPWSIVPWIDGDTVHCCPLDAQGADDLLQFLIALHRPERKLISINPLRGCPIANKSAVFETHWSEFASKNALNASLIQTLRSIWDQGLEAPPADQLVWIHGDLHARNVLSQDGHILGVIDWGDVCQGDPATDLASLWMLIEDDALRHTIRVQYPDQRTSTWQRARGWALFFGVILYVTGHAEADGHPQHAAMGRDTLLRLDREQKKGFT